MNENHSSGKSEALKQLKSILLTEDQQRIAKLEEQLTLLKSQFQNKEELIDAINPIVAELITRRIRDSKAEMADALAPVMSDAIKRQIADAKDEVVDALYPVIGKTIRKSIAEAMKNLAETVNTKIERAFSFHFIFNRFKARMSGLSEEQILLKESLPFCVHDIFFIHKATGILLCHGSNQSVPANADEDLISGMLTAIREFSKTAFSDQDEMDLKEIEYDNRQILIEAGRHAYLAFVVSGVYPDNFAQKIHDLENELHKKYASLLRQFDGDIEPFIAVKKRLSKCIQTFSFETAENKEKDKKRRLPYGLIVLFSLIIFVIALYIIFLYPKSDTTVEAGKSGTTIPLSSENFGDLILQVQTALNGQISTNLSQLRLLVDGDILIIEGYVDSEKDKILIGNTLARIAGFPVILNNLNSIELKSETSVVKKIENTTIYFMKQSSELDWNAQVQLNRMSKDLINFDFKAIHISGCSDSSGSDEINQKISSQRAINVKDYLVDKGIDPVKLIISVKADSAPASHSNPEENRRVTFKIEK